MANMNLESVMNSKNINKYRNIPSLNVSSDPLFCKLKLEQSRSQETRKWALGNMLREEVVYYKVRRWDSGGAEA